MSHFGVSPAFHQRKAELKASSQLKSSRIFHQGNEHLSSQSSLSSVKATPHLPSGGISVKTSPIFPHSESSLPSSQMLASLKWHHQSSQVQSFAKQNRPSRRVLSSSRQIPSCVKPSATSLISHQVKSCFRSAFSHPDSSYCKSLLRTGLLLRTLLLGQL